MLGIGLGVTSVQQRGMLVDDGGAGLPAGATAYGSFENGTYNAPSGNTFDDFLYENTDYGTWEGEVVPGVGFVPAANTQNISIGADLTAELIASGTMTLVANVILSANANFYLEMINLPDWTQDIYAGANTNVDLSVLSAVATVSGFNASPVVPTTGTVRVAIAMSSSEGCRSSVNGSACTEAALGGSFLANFAGLWVRNATIKDLTFYAGVKTNAELEALSA
jgi:hypothetical protein